MVLDLELILILRCPIDIFVASFSRKDDELDVRGELKQMWYIIKKMNHTCCEHLCTLVHWCTANCFKYEMMALAVGSTSELATLYVAAPPSSS